MDLMRGRVMGTVPEVRVHPQNNAGQVGERGLPPRLSVSAPDSPWGQGLAVSAGGSLAGARSWAKCDSFP